MMPSNNNNSTSSTDADAAADKNTKESNNNKRQPSLLDSLLVSPAHNATDAGFGILCNDPSGLCLSATGSFIVSKEKQNATTNKAGAGADSSFSSSLANVDDSVKSGIYTSLTKLAHQLHPGSISTTTDSSSAATTVAPLITIESEFANLLIKEYDGHAIALKVPATLLRNNNHNNLNHNNDNNTSALGGETGSANNGGGTPTSNSEAANTGGGGST